MRGTNFCTDALLGAIYAELGGCWPRLLIWNISATGKGKIDT